MFSDRSHTPTLPDAVAQSSVPSLLSVAGGPAECSRGQATVWYKSTWRAKDA
ncbi:uncharacterized protein CCOS01_01063 [Colletotrichum costaricense]|uniref:Uncharacterized protein n=1 Tax=Colletotrichum costaricense TaxID=1209916 RepID=A0AAJ0E8J5_9PEZI|nr:uncharacterized protein CCOS01_01063 [Colletotrichum costaricense]KAK1539749.1 hypothetical protein CCOS01_01063 [Colletotrichum costaricense]